MRIQNNIPSMKTYRSLKGSRAAIQKSLEKLASGYQINRAADDAAGLAVSEKMRMQITGLSTALKNCKDVSSLLQTAEGGLTELHEMLNRALTLAEQSANGTYDDSTDRAQLQKELENLCTEIDRIAEGTSFNGVELLHMDHAEEDTAALTAAEDIAAVADTEPEEPMMLTEPAVLALESSAPVVRMASVRAAAPVGRAAEIVCGDFTISGDGLTEGTDYTFSGGVLTIKSNTAITIRNTDPTKTTSHRISTVSGLNANITLAGVNISAGYQACAFNAASGSNITITLADGTNNVLRSGHLNAGLQKNSTNGLLEIKGNGSLAAYGGEGCAGIGGGNYGNSGNILISGGTIKAQGSSNAAGIGGGNRGSGKNITISGGNVTAIGGSRASGIGGGNGSSGSSGNMITGGIVTATGKDGKSALNGFSGVSVGTATSATIVGNGAEMTLDGNKTISGDTVEVMSGGKLTVKRSSVLTVGSSGKLVNNGTVTVNGELSNNGTVVNNGTINGTGKLSGTEITDGTISMTGPTGAFTVSGGTLGTDYEFENGILKILTDAAIIIKNTDPAAAATDRIAVDPGVNANITLDGVNIDVSSQMNTPAFMIADDSTGNVTVTLRGENMLVGGYGCPGLQKNGDVDGIGSLTIKGDGSLTACGGDCAAGIGCCHRNVSCNITIEGGNITAIGGDFGAGIGGSYLGTSHNITGTSHNITITGGNIIACGGEDGAGIGGGQNSDGYDITITGGKVMAMGTDGGADIGDTNGNVTINGGTVTTFGQTGIAGSFSTGTDGHAVITASGGKDAIENNADTTGWDAVIIDSATKTGDVYGSVTSKENIEFANGLTITISEGNSLLTVGANTTLTNNGTIINNGTLKIDPNGTLVNNGAIKNKGTFENNGTLTGNAVENISPVSPGLPDSCAFTVTGGTYGTDYTYESNTLKILTNTALTIAGKGVVTTDKILVAGGTDANITLKNVNIDVSSTRQVAAFKIEDDSTGTVTVTLVGSSSLTSGEDCAGLEKNGENGQLIIQGDGSLTVAGGGGAAGIGAGSRKGVCGITISGGTINTAGGDSGAGIGVGFGGAKCHDINITGGTITTTGGNYGAGIGGGQGSGEVYDIEISGGTVIANGGSYGDSGGGAGIGGGRGGTSHNIRITGGGVTASGGNQSAGIGGGSGGQGKDITVSGGVVTATGGIDGGAGIGGGKDGNGSGITISGSSTVVSATGNGGGEKIGNGNNATGTATVNRNGGLIIEGDTGKIYGNVTLTADYNIASTVTLEIDHDTAESHSLTVGTGVTLTNEGTINIKQGDALTVQGTLVNNGTINNEGDFETEKGSKTENGGNFNNKDGGNATLGDDFENKSGSKMENEFGAEIELDDGKIITDDGAEFKNEGNIGGKGSIIGKEPTGTGTIGNGVTVGGTTPDPPHEGVIRFQIGVESWETLDFQLEDMCCTSLGIYGLSIASQDGAADAIDPLKKAVNQVSGYRGYIGALQNRIDHTINNLGIMAENLTDAESRIRDTDMAAEMMKYVKSNILIQSAQAMLAQANQLPQAALRLLE